VEKAQALMPRWRVDIIRKRAEHLGTVDAVTEKEAIERAAERLDIPRDRRRIAVQKIGKDKDWPRQYAQAGLVPPPIVLA
jgi:hypothetical protein